MGSRTRKPIPHPSCPCDSGRDYADCCGRYLDGGAVPPTAEALMRSRYTAWVRERADWLRATWHPDTCPAELTFDPARRWLGLQVLATTAGAPADATGSVEFVARSQSGGRATRHHEISRFERWQGRWVYHSGSAPPIPTSRGAPSPPML